MTEEVDQLPDLPDAIINHIFCFLPLNDLVTTSVLSKQWRCAWTSTPYIYLTLPSRHLFPLIGEALSLCKATKVEKFHVDVTMYDFGITAELDRLFCFAAARKVEDVCLGFEKEYRFAPRSLYDCASLVSLRLSRCLFPRDIFTIHWPSLKKLCLHDVPMGNGELIKILSGCPVLESLTLHFGPVPCDLWIDSRSLRELVIESVCITSLEVSASNLLSLHWRGTFPLGGFRLNGASSLAEAKLNFKKPKTDLLGYSPDGLNFALEQLQHVAKITIGSWCLEVLLAANVKTAPHLSLRWRNMIVHTTICKHEVVGMLYLLQSSPLLERLVICNPKSDDESTRKPYRLCNLDEEHFWRKAKESDHLKRVEIVGFQFDYVPMLALAKILLRTSVELEKMIIDAELRESYRGVPIYPHDLIQLQEGCRRASRKAEVIVNYRFNGLPYLL